MMHQTTTAQAFKLVRFNDSGDSEQELELTPAEFDALAQRLPVLREIQTTTEEH